MPRKSVAPERRDQIINALFRCLAEKGHESVTVKDIAREADLHYGVIHYYFKSKDDIVSALAGSIVEKYDRLLTERTQSSRSASKRLLRALDFLVDEFIFNRRLNRVFYNLVQMAFENDTIRAALRRQLRIYRRRITEVVQEGIESGEFKRRDAAASARLIVALLEGMALQWVIEPRALNREDVRKLIRETVVIRLKGS